jgi:hypothetical protein
MYKVAGLILLALVGLSSLPYLLYWLLWFFTGRGLPLSGNEGARDPFGGPKRPGL